MKKQKLLCILHYAPPAHGASKVGDFIKSSQKLKDEFDCRFIKIKSSISLVLESLLLALKIPLHLYIHTLLVYQIFQKPAL